MVKMRDGRRSCNVMCHGAFGNICHCICKGRFHGFDTGRGDLEEVTWEPPKARKHKGQLELGLTNES